MNTSKVICPGCKIAFLYPVYSTIQNHLWTTHKIDLCVSEQIAIRMLQHDFKAIDWAKEIAWKK